MNNSRQRRRAPRVAQNKSEAPKPGHPAKATAVVTPPAKPNASDHKAADILAALPLNLFIVAFVLPQAVEAVDVITKALSHYTPSVEVDRRNQWVRIKATFADTTQRDIAWAAFAEATGYVTATKPAN